MSTGSDALRQLGVSTGPAAADASGVGTHGRIIAFNIENITFCNVVQQQLHHCGSEQCPGQEV